MDETQQAEDSINKDPKELVHDSMGIKEGSIGENTDTYFKYKVKPKVSVGKILKGDISGAIEKTSLSIEFGKDFKEDDVEIVFKVNGNVAACLNSPSKSKKFEASFCATKRF